MDKSSKRKVNYQEELELALRAREQYLEKHPELQSFQDEIDRILAKSENRMEALVFLIQKKLFELSDSIADMQSSLKIQSGKVGAANAGLVPGKDKSSTGYLN